MDPGGNIVGHHFEIFTVAIMTCLLLRNVCVQFNPVGFSLFLCVCFFFGGICAILWNVVFSVRRFPPSGYNFWVSTVL